MLAMNNMNINKDKLLSVKKRLADLNEYFTGYITALKTLLEDFENGYIS